MYRVRSSEFMTTVPVFNEMSCSDARPPINTATICFSDKETPFLRIARHGAEAALKRRNCYKEPIERSEVTESRYNLLRSFSTSPSSTTQSRPGHPPSPVGFLFRLTAGIHSVFQAIPSLFHIRDAPRDFLEGLILAHLFQPRACPLQLACKEAPR